MHTSPMKESEGTFSEWNPCKSTECRRCKSKNVKFRVWDSSCGGYEDYNYKCDDCGHSWWIDGIDS